MANKSGWKNFEKQVATALGGTRRFRTMGSFATVADDIRFSKGMRKQYPKLKTLAVECKKRKAANVHAFFADAKVKYGEKGKKRIILASRVPRKGSLGKLLKKSKALLSRNTERKLADIATKLRKKGKLSLKRLDKISKRLYKIRDHRIAEAAKRLRARHDMSPLVTVELAFFQELWESWLAYNTGEEYYYDGE